jgi:hypothetical protein
MKKSGARADSKTDKMKAAKRPASSASTGNGAGSGSGSGSGSDGAGGAKARGPLRKKQQQQKQQQQKQQSSGTKKAASRRSADDDSISDEIAAMIGSGGFMPGSEDEDDDDDYDEYDGAAATTGSADEDDDEGFAYDGSSVMEALRLMKQQLGDDDNDDDDDMEEEEIEEKSKKTTKAKKERKDKKRKIELPEEDGEEFEEIEIPMHNDADELEAENPSFEQNSDHNAVKPEVQSAEAKPKLTKQQKRDLKRSAVAAAAASSDDVDDSDAVHVSSASSRLLDTSLPVIREEGSSVYKRTPHFPTAMPHLKTAKRFLVPGDEHYKKVMANCYYNFKLDAPEAYPQTFHNRFSCTLWLSVCNAARTDSVGIDADALEGLDKANVYQVCGTAFVDIFIRHVSSEYVQFDITQPLGLDTKLAKTMVTRCLVGISGITYKYLGIRMFAYSWESGAVGEQTGSFLHIGRNACLRACACFVLSGATNEFVELGKLSSDLSERTAKHLSSLSKELKASHPDEDVTMGSCQYNMILINKCQPESKFISKWYDLLFDDV